MEGGIDLSRCDCTRTFHFLGLRFFKNLHEPAAAGAMVGIIDLLAQCKLLATEARDPQQWYKCTSTRLREASTSIKAMLNSPLTHEQPKDGRDLLDACGPTNRR